LVPEHAKEEEGGPWEDSVDRPGETESYGRFPVDDVANINCCCIPDEAEEACMALPSSIPVKSVVDASDMNRFGVRATGAGPRKALGRAPCSEQAAASCVKRISRNICCFFPVAALVHNSISTQITKKSQQVSTSTKITFFVIL
jgi:hypothetical protein